MLRPFARSLSIATLFFANSFCSNKLVLCFAILIEFHPVTRLIQASFSLTCMFCFLVKFQGHLILRLCLSLCVHTQGNKMEFDMKH